MSRVILSRSFSPYLSIPLTWLCVSVAPGSTIRLQPEELETHLTVGYAVRMLDMNSDGRLDIVILDSKRLLWLENPSWSEHTIHEDPTKEHDNVSFAACDIDRDGRVDFALGADWQFNNTQSGGTIGWLWAPSDPESPWMYYPIGEEPTVHRMHFVDLDGDRREELLVLPLKGRNTTAPDFADNGVRLLSYTIPGTPRSSPWPVEVIHDQLHVAHNFSPTDLDGDGSMELLVASFEGVTLLERGGDGTWNSTLIGAGNQLSSPNRGASEVKRCRLRNNGDYLATIEPWHGNQVVTYRRPQKPRPERGPWPWTRQVLDEDLAWGHAVWCADLDDDQNDELIVGVRDDKSPAARRGLRTYSPSGVSKTEWVRQVVDPGGVAIEDLAAGDLNRDGKVDIVAVGRQTHNVKIYWNLTP